MRDVGLLDLGLCSPLKSQAMYHAVASAMVPGDANTVILCRPRRPYVCIGRHQELHCEVDTEACRRMALPVLRRAVGGGAVYLDRQQLFFQLIWRQDQVPARIADAFEYFSRAPVDCYRRLGLAEAHFAAVNDLQMQGRKIGGLGAASVGNAFIFVGSIIMDFDARAAASVLKVAEEKMRDKIAQSIEAYVSSLRKELGRPFRVSLVCHELVAALERSFDARLVPRQPTAPELKQYRSWSSIMRSRQWLDEVRLSRQRPRELRITGRVHVLQGVDKARGALVRVTLVVEAQRVVDALVSGDFYAIGEACSVLERALEGPAAAELIALRLREVWPGLEIPGVELENVLMASERALAQASASRLAEAPDLSQSRSSSAGNASCAAAS